MTQLSRNDWGGSPNVMSAVEWIFLFLISVMISGCVQHRTASVIHTESPLISEATTNGQNVFDFANQCMTLTVEVEHLRACVDQKTFATVNGAKKREQKLQVGDLFRYETYRINKHVDWDEDIP